MQRERSRKSYVWRSILEGWKVLRRGLKWRIGTSKDIQFWNGTWLVEHPLREVCETEFPQEEMEKRVGECWCERRGWKREELGKSLNADLLGRLIRVQIVWTTGNKDRVRWDQDASGCFTTSSANNMMLEEEAVGIENKGRSCGNRKDRGGGNLICGSLDTKSY